MARTNLTVNKVTENGLVPVTKVAGTVDGHMFGNSGSVWLEVANANAATRVLTVVTPATYGGLALADKTVTVPASATGFKVGPFRTAFYNRPSGGTDPGKVYVNFPAGQETDLSVAAYSI